jgi:glycine/D-amino acid oxidase-like deaminating enzyme
MNSFYQATDYSHIVVGGGVYGCYLALKLREIAPDARVLLLEREDDLLLRASYNNQARIHNGYHYPRSLLTGLRSRLNFPRFIQEFPDCVDGDFEKLYAIGIERSKVTGAQFSQFCQRIGSDIKQAPARFQKLFNPQRIEQVFIVKEYAFNAKKLKDLLKERLAKNGIHILTNAEAIQVLRTEESSKKNRICLSVKNRRSGEMTAFESQYLYNCTYANLNALPANSGLDKLYLKHEATEIALVQVPSCLENLGITIMCGPFFSVMPFPAKGLFSFSHVSYTPHYEWSEIPSADNFQQHFPKFPLMSNFERMVRDAARYMPVLRECNYVESLWEIKTILPQSEGDDSRPILFKRDSAFPGFISVLGGKIDNIFDLDKALIENH